MNAHQRRVKRRHLERSYEAYLNACAAHCRCCSCIGVCAAVLAGGFCDELCFCRHSTGRGDYDERFDDDGGEEDWRDLD